MYTILLWFFFAGGLWWILMNFPSTQLYLSMLDSDADMKVVRESPTKEICKQKEEPDYEKDRLRFEKNGDFDKARQAGEHLAQRFLEYPYPKWSHSEKSEEEILRNQKILFVFLVFYLSQQEWHVLLAETVRSTFFKTLKQQVGEEALSSWKDDAANSLYLLCMRTSESPGDCMLEQFMKLTGLLEEYKPEASAFCKRLAQDIHNEMEEAICN